MKKDKLTKVKGINVEEISSPEFLKTLNNDELSFLATKIREYIIDAVSKNGGHLSSNLGNVESTMMLHKVFDFSKDKLIFDVGHQSYTHKILTGRKLDHLRQKDGVSGFQKISESSYDHFEAGHSSTSLSAALGLATARDLSGEHYNVIAYIGDGAIASGLSFEALNNISQTPHKVIIVLNDNDMSISKPKGGLSNAFSKISTGYGYNKFKKGFSNRMNRFKFGRWILKRSRSIKNWFRAQLLSPNLFESLGLAYIGLVDGHNFKQLEKAYKRALNTDKSVVIHIHTVKGKGYKYSEIDKDGYWHGVGPFDKKTGKPLVSHEGQISWSKLTANFVEEEMAKNEKALLICPAMTKGSELDDIFTKYKNRCFDVGIAEEHAFTYASSLSLAGYHPIISVYSTFMQRAYDEIAHDLARMESSSTIIVDRSGLVGNDGETHQGVYDEAYVNTIPNVIVSMPGDAKEAKALVKLSMTSDRPFFIRIPRSFIEEPKEVEDLSLEVGKWLVEQESLSKGKALIYVGPLGKEISRKLVDNSTDITLVNALFANPIDDKVLKDLLSYKEIIIYDPYSTKEGLIESVNLKLNELGYKGAIKSLCVPTQYIKQASIKEQLIEFDLDTESVYAQITK